MDQRKVEHPQSPPTTALQQESSSSSSGITKIKNIHPTKTNITVLARVIIKSDIHPFLNEKGPSVMSTINLQDDTGEVKLTAFGARMSQLFDTVKVEKLYYVKGFVVQSSNSTKSFNEFDMICTDKTKIVPCHASLDIPTLTFDNIKAIADVEFMEKDTIVDILAICEEYGEMQFINLKSGDPGRKRDLWLLDQSSRKIMLTIWGTNADKFRNNKFGCVIAIKRARVTNYAKRSLDSSCLSSSTFRVDPDIPEAEILRKWYSTERKTNEVKLLSSHNHPTVEFLALARSVMK